MRDRAYESYLRDCLVENITPVTHAVFRKFYGLADVKPRTTDPSPVSFEYAEYLTSMRKVWGEHTCERNLPADGVCKCKSYYHYSQSEHRDEWREIDAPIGEDFIGEFLPGNRKEYRGVYTEREIREGYTTQDRTPWDRMTDEERAKAAG